MKSSLTQSVSDLIREHVCGVYLRTAVQRRQGTFAVNVGEVHKALGLSNRVPQVCAALASKKFLAENHLRILSKNGPASGQSTTVTFTYEILSSGNQLASVANSLAALRGAAKDVFSKLGGGDAFIRSERTAFTDEKN